MSTYYRLLAQIMTAYVVNGQFKTCTDNQDCAWTTITCNDTQPDCILSCLEQWSCSGVIYICNGVNNECHLQCAQKQACQFVSVTSNVSTSIYCDGDTDVCDDSTVHVTQGSKPVSVNMTCDKIGGYYGCANVDIVVSGSHPNNQLNVYCAEGQAGGRNCDDMNITCGFDNSQCQVECETTALRSCDTDCLLACPNNGIGTTCKIINHPNVGFKYTYTFAPSKSPTSTTISPSFIPTVNPTNNPTTQPTTIPSFIPTVNPTNNPTSQPTVNPSKTPSTSPTQPPSLSPSFSPSFAPSSPPSTSPSIAPSISPSNIPSNNPSLTPSSPPTNAPSISPSVSPSNTPTNPPTISPTETPSIAPSVPPSITPSNNPSIAPSVSPSYTPTLRPTSFEDMNNIISNYVMNDDFAINNFKFPAAIGQCMQYQYGSE
eukprot:376748_1